MACTFRRTAFLLLLSTIVTVSAGCERRQAAAPGSSVASLEPELAWMRDRMSDVSKRDARDVYEHAVEVAKSDQKNIMLHLTAPW